MHSAGCTALRNHKSGIMSCVPPAVFQSPQVLQSLRKDNVPVVIDADGLHLIKNNLELLRGWTAATLTPNRNEYARLADAVGIKVDEKDPTAQLEQVTAITLRLDMLPYAGLVAAILHCFVPT